MNLYKINTNYYVVAYSATEAIEKFQKRFEYLELTSVELMIKLDII